MRPSTPPHHIGSMPASCRDCREYRRVAAEAQEVGHAANALSERLAAELAQEQRRWWPRAWHLGLALAVLVAVFFGGASLIHAVRGEWWEAARAAGFLVSLAWLAHWVTGDDG